MTPSRLQGWMLGAGLLLVLLGSRAGAQFDFPSPAELPEVVHAQQMPRDYRTLSTLVQAEAALAGGPDKYELAAEQLQQVLDQPYDQFLLKNNVVDVGLRRHVDLLMAASPQAFRDLYNRQFNTEAQQLLTDAVKTGDQAQLVQVIRRFSWTTAGQRAREALALQYLDRGQFARGARLLQTLLDFPSVRHDRPDLSILVARCWAIAGQDREAVATLMKLREGGVERIRFGTKTVPLMTDETQALTWLKDLTGPLALAESPAVAAWTLPRGAADGHATTVSSSPLATGAWNGLLIDGYDVAPLFPDEAKVREKVDELNAYLIRQEQKYIIDNTLKKPLAPAAIPLVVDGTVITSGPGSIKAFDVATGQFLWTTVEVDSTFQTLCRLAEKAPNVFSTQRLIDAFLAQRSWVNRTAASLSSDGEYVYAVMDTGMLVAPRGLPFAPAISRNLPQIRSDNRLVAFELSTQGKLRWSMGGRISSRAEIDPAGDPTDALPGLQGAYFLGPPLPADGVLYVLVEDRGQVKLFALNSRPRNPMGEVLWSLPLMNPTASSFILDNAGRRMGALTPAYAGGVMVCELMDGIVTAVDPIQRRVLWTRQYRPPEPMVSRNQLIMQAMQVTQQGEERVVEQQIRDIGWWDSTPVIAEDLVLLTPQDDKLLHAFRLDNGEPAWEPIDRSDNLYIAGLDGDRFILVGQRGVEARKIATGALVWRRPLEAPGVSGRGTQHNGRLTIPTGSGDLVTLDLKSGEILAQSPMPPKVLSGNLVSVQGQTFLQTATRIYGYPSLQKVEQEILDQLARDPADAAALSRSGALALHKGESAKGQAALRAALLKADLPDARRLLAWSLLAEIRTDFEANRKVLPELEKLATDPDQKFWLHLTTAEGLSRLGDDAAALREYMALPIQPGMREIDSDLLVSGRRWIRGKVENLLKNSTNPAPLRAEVEQMLASVEMEHNPELLLEAIRTIGIDPASEAVTLRLPESDKLPASQRVREQRLWWIAAHGSPSHRAAASALLVESNLKRGQYEPVIDQIHRLQTEWESQPVLNGKTGKELLAAWKQDAERGGPLRTLPDWRRALLEADPPIDVRMGVPTFPIATRGPITGPLHGWSFEISSNGAILSAHDRFGVDSRLTASTGIDSSHGLYQTRYLSTIGRLAIYVAANQFQIVDSATGETVFKDMLIERSQLQQFTGNMGGRPLMPEELKDGIRGMLVPGLIGSNFVGNVGQPTVDSLCYQRGEQLFCIDPATGEFHWIRSDVPEGSEILMDEEYVVVAPPSPAPLLPPLTVYRTSDGTEVEHSQCPKDVVRSRRGADWGRLLMTASPGPATIIYSMFDPATSATLWTHDFPAHTEWTSADGENIAFLTPGGEFMVIDFRTGAVLCKADVPPTESLDGLAVRDDGERYVVMTWRYGNPAQRGQGVLKHDPRERELHPNGSMRHFESFQRTEFSGPIFAVDRSGKMTWKLDAPTARPRMVSASVPVDWPVLLVLEERRPTPEADWAAVLSLIDVRSGETIQKGDFSETRTKDRFPWRLDAINRLTVANSSHGFTVRLKNPDGSMMAPTMRDPKPKTEEDDAPPPQDEPPKGEIKEI
jgi:outer membrane protein assembly factor BamB